MALEVAGYLSDNVGILTDALGAPAPGQLSAQIPPQRVGYNVPRGRAQHLRVTAIRNFNLSTNSRLEVYKNNAPTGVFVTITALSLPMTEFNDLGNFVDFADGDQLDIAVLCENGLANSDGWDFACSVTLEFNGGVTPPLPPVVIHPFTMLRFSGFTSVSS